MEQFIVKELVSGGMRGSGPEACRTNYRREGDERSQRVLYAQREVAGGKRREQWVPSVGSYKVSVCRCTSKLRGSGPTRHQIFSQRTLP